jgi:hypothetical protein
MAGCGSTMVGWVWSDHVPLMQRGSRQTEPAVVSDLGQQTLRDVADVGCIASQTATHGLRIVTDDPTEITATLAAAEGDSKAWL